MLSKRKTIVACSTPPGRGAISTVRLSGYKAIDIIQKITRRKLKKKSCVLEFPLKKGLKEKCVLTIFRSPNSYTGENVVEISTHGNPLIVEKVIQQCVNAGAFIAEPGEFTLRAYLNNKLTIDQSEAVIEVINANSLASLKAAQNSLNGGLRMRISKVQQKLREARVLVETLIDFVDEDVDIFIEEVKDKIDEIKKGLKNELSRESEMIADNNAAKMFINAGFDKNTCLNEITFIAEKMQWEADTDIKSTHPGYLERFESLQNFIAKYDKSTELKDFEPYRWKWSFDRKLNILIFTPQKK